VGTLAARPGRPGSDQPSTPPAARHERREGYQPVINPICGAGRAGAAIR